MRQESALAKEPRSPNNLLASLSPKDFELLRPHLRQEELIHEVVLARAGETLDRVYFPHSGIISLVLSLAGGEKIEVAMIGRDSIFGASAALNGQAALNDAIVQLPGEASTLDVAHLRAAAQQSVSFRTALIRHAEFVFVQAQQSAACNASHTLEARLARWLLRARDLSGSDTLLLKQEFLGQMLGVQRTSVSLVANALNAAGLIDYRRGRIEITNLDGLRDCSCECYTMVKTQYDRLLGK
jgi:CRP-like cAMP-binding protein